MGYASKSDKEAAQGVLEWLFENSRGAITEFEEAQLTEESIYEGLTSEESPPSGDTENQVWDWLTGTGKGPSAPARERDRSG